MLRHLLTEAGLHRAIDAPELDTGDEHYGLLLSLPECGRIQSPTAVPSASMVEKYDGSEWRRHARG